MDDILRLIYPRQTTQHTYVEEVLGPDAFVIRKGRRFYELRLCSIRLPADSEHADPIASALSNVLLLERVTAEYCCVDAPPFRLRGCRDRHRNESCRAAVMSPVAG